jgi:hypothetical protein
MNPSAAGVGVEWGNLGASGVVSRGIISPGFLAEKVRKIGYKNFVRRF